MKTIYLHVGNLKTGTSAIQQFCSDQRNELLDSGYDYLRCARPKKNVTNHGKIPISLMQKYGAHVPLWYGDSDDFETIRQRVTDEINSSNCDNIIISSEEFYRIAGYGKKKQELIAADLYSLFADFTVKVVMYVRDPLEFSKSWYNEVNKGNIPHKRFTDFFYALDESYLIPQQNARFWRHLFGQECIILEPYHLLGKEHITRFTSLLGVEIPSTLFISRPNVNVKRDEETLEQDRVRRIMALADATEREKYLRNSVFKTLDNFQALTDKVHRVRKGFDDFCLREKVNLPDSTLSLASLLIHEEVVNRNDYALKDLHLNKTAKLSSSALVDMLRKLRRSPR